MSPMELTAALLGVGVLLLIALAVRRREFDAEAPKYEMLGQSPPAQTPRLPAGKLSPVDRIVRLGLIGAACYYAWRVGWSSPFGIALSVIGAYATATGLWGRDPLYLWWEKARG